MPRAWTRGLLRLFLLSISLFAVFAAPVGSFLSTAGRGGLVVTAIQLQPVVTTGLSFPVYLTNAHDGSNRIFIVELGGTVKVLRPGQTAPTNFLDITSRVLSGGEQGLLGLAFHPQFQMNGRFFVNYTRKPDGATVIAEYLAPAATPNLADSTEKVILTFAQPFTNHNGGMIEFGTDGFLYIAAGDGGSANDPGNRAQNTNELLGKILRIDIDHPDGAAQYSSPSDNPFFGGTPGRDEIYAYGLRNPWRFSFDRGTGQLYAGDVGQGAREEIDIITRGGNYGWRVYEGNNCTNLDPSLCGTGGFIFPIAEYSHSGGRCSITGGYVYRGPIATLSAGTYVHADFCTGEIFSLQGATQTLLLDTALNISSFGEDEAGEIYVVGLGGTVDRIVNPSAPCSFHISPSSRSFLAMGGVGSVGVTAPLNCNWNAMSNDNFIALTSASSGTGVGAVTFSVAPNPGAARIGTITVSGQTFTVTQSKEENLFDFDGDRKADISVYRGSTGQWLILNSSNGQGPVQSWGYPSSQDVPAPADYDGDGKTDIAVYRGSTGQWLILNSSNGQGTVQSWGYPSLQDIPVPADYDGDGKADLAVYRNATGQWLILNSSNGQSTVQSWGYPSLDDRPIPADYDGDGKADIAVYRNGTGQWLILSSSNGQGSVQGWGYPSLQDKPVPRDYDGDGRADIAVYRNSTGQWLILNSSNGQGVVQAWGFPSLQDMPVPADYDGDEKADLAVYRNSTGQWLILNSSNGQSTAQKWGFPSLQDVPLPGVNTN